MITTIIPAYPYEQYADDEDIRAFFDAANAAMQSYLDWFNQAGISLAFYPSLSGPLLDWVAQGVYGTARPAVGQQGAPAIGPLNTQLLDVSPLNTFTAPTASTYYTLSDDAFKRVLTWNLYRGDGYRFNPMWLRRRVMRFFMGANGLDPSPWYPGFTVGVENITPIGVSVSAGTLTVTVHQSALQTLVPSVTSQLISLFQLLFPSGYLQLPLQYSLYAVTLA